MSVISLIELVKTFSISLRDLQNNEINGLEFDRDNVRQENRYMRHNTTSVCSSVLGYFLLFTL